MDYHIEGTGKATASVAKSVCAPINYLVSDRQSTAPAVIYLEDLGSLSKACQELKRASGQ